MAFWSGDLATFFGASSSDSSSDDYWAGFFFCWGFWSGDLATGDLATTFLAGLAYS